MASKQKQQKQKYKGNPLGGLLWLTGILSLSSIAVALITVFLMAIAVGLISALGIPLAWSFAIGMILLLVGDAFVYIPIAGFCDRKMEDVYGQAKTKWFYTYALAVAILLALVGAAAFCSVAEINLIESVHWLEPVIGKTSTLYQTVDTIMMPIVNILKNTTAEGFWEAYMQLLREEYMVIVLVLCEGLLVGLAMSASLFGGAACDNCKRAYMMIHQDTRTGNSYTETRYKETKGHYETKTSTVTSAWDSSDIHARIYEDVYVPGTKEKVGVYQYTDVYRTSVCPCCGRTKTSKSTNVERIE